MEVTHIKKPFRRSYTLKINTDGNLTITTNISFSKSRVQALLDKHSSWIHKTRERILKQQSRIKRAKKNFVDGEMINILGAPYSIKLINSRRKSPKAFLEDDFLIVDQGSMDLSQEDIKGVISKTLKKVLYEYIENRSVSYLYSYNLSANKISIKNQSSRWGSCSHKRNLNFNLKLIFCPLEMIDYVIVHEICHLKEMNHSQKFWNLVEKEFPHHKVMRKWFKENGPEIMAILD